MKNTRSLLWNCHFYRPFCTSNVNNSASREARFFNKFISESNTKRSKWYNNKSVIPLLNINKKQSITICPRRVTVLNKLFMKHVTDLLSTGEVSPELTGKGLEITHVMITRNYDLLQVYWYTRNNAKLMEQILQTCAGRLRHELSQLQLMGVVPPIQFVKNKKLFLHDEVTMLLSAVKTECDNETEKVKDEENVKLNTANVADNYSVTVPRMTHDTFNINHNSIMEKVKKSLAKSRKAERLRSEGRISKEESQLVNSDNVIEHLEMKHDMELLSKFLKKRKIDEKRKKLASINYYLDREVCDLGNEHADEYDDQISEQFFDTTEEYEEKDFES